MGETGGETGPDFGFWCIGNFGSIMEPVSTLHRRFTLNLAISKDYLKTSLRAFHVDLYHVILIFTY